MKRTLLLSGGDLDYLARSDCRKYLAGQQKFALARDWEFKCAVFNGKGPECSWQKLGQILFWFNAGFNEILWLDPDVEVRKLDRELGLTHDLIFSADAQGLCCGAFFIRGEHSASLIATAMLIGRLPARVDAQYGVYKYEQNTIKHLVLTTSAWKYESFHHDEIACNDSPKSTVADCTMYHHWITGLNK